MSIPIPALIAAVAVTAAAIPTTTMYAGMPPARFQGDNTVTIRFVPEPNSKDACGVASNGYRFLACVRGDVLILPNPCPEGDAQRFARLTCHELAHKNGWPGTHGE